jgi:hypothetical protein
VRWRRPSGSTLPSAVFSAAPFLDAGHAAPYTEARISVTLAVGRAGAGAGSTSHRCRS